MNSTQRRFQWKTALGRAPMALDDALRNRHCTADSQRIVVMRHPGKHASMYRDFSRWVARWVPQLRQRLQFRHAYASPAPTDGVSACVAWIHDTVEQWSPSGYQNVLRILQSYREAGITCINPMNHMANIGKLRGSERMRAAGVRTPKCCWLPQSWLTDRSARNIEPWGLDFPVLIREERGHGQPSLRLNNAEQLRAANLGRFQLPIVVEFIDTRQNGVFRKLRYVVAGDVGVPRHLMVDGQWDVRPHRRQHDEPFRTEEADFVSRPMPLAEHRMFQAARRALEMDVVGFDYSYTSRGELVIWEANPCLEMNFPKHATCGRLDAAVERTYAAVARCYLRAAGVAVPDVVAETLGEIAVYDHQAGAGEAAA